MEIVTYVDNLWILIAGILVMFMQPGFMLVETGFTRSKNSVNIVMKNFMDFSVGALTYWAFGFAFAYGGSTLGGFIAYGNFFLEGESSTYFFQVVFAATAATIVSGSVAERTKFSSYLLFQPFICGLIYPIVTHWVWSGQGWLTDIGFVDFAGSGVVHMVGGFAALAGIQVVGPRIGKFDSNGKPLPIPGSSMVAAALGVFILWFGWYGFNVGSALAAVDVDLAAIAVTTTLSASAASVAAMYTSMIAGKPNVGMTLNGALSGLAFICGLIYPIVTHWVWSGQGWLTDIGFVDFAGSGVVHMVGGFAALAGIQVVGPRIGKFDSNGKPLPIPGSSMVAAALGVFILWFGWYGFNVGSALAAVDVDLAAIAVTTTLSASAASVAAMYTSMIAGKPNVGMTLNGALSGLVGITAGCANVNNLGAVIIGLVSGVLVVGSINLIERKGLDDAVGAVSVHGVCGAWGVLAVSLFDTSEGVFYGGTSLLVPQVIGILAIGSWAYLTSYAVLKVIDLNFGLRVSKEEEIAGLDVSEHGTTAYGDFILKK
jgi:Amt family ammonium transporter